MPETRLGVVRGIAIKEFETGPMRELTEAYAMAAKGLEGDVPSSIQRGVTFLSAQQWGETQRELGVEASWHTRRANLLIECGPMMSWIGRVVRVGEALIAIRGETRPCARMDAQVAGLTRALARDCRGGVHGEVLQTGRIRIDDAVVDATETVRI